MADMEMSEGSQAQTNIAEFLAIVSDPANRPVLVHCEYGNARTGFAVAAYRIAGEDWTYEKALAEALDFHFNPDNSTNRQYEQILRRLSEVGLSGATGQVSLPADGAPATARRAGGF